MKSSTRLSISALGFIAAALFAGPAKAQNYPWCAIYSGSAVGGGTNCGFVSYEQCMATARGLGSFCYPEHTIRAAGRPACTALFVSVLKAS